jgi:acyl-CoA thioester hydrolase
MNRTVFKHSFQIRWVDTDTAQVMHYSKYFRYFEACEEEFYRSLGLSFAGIWEKYQVGLPRVEAHCVYKSPSRYNDRIQVTLKVQEITQKTITYHFQVSLPEKDLLAAEGYLKVIAVNENWKAVPVPIELAKVIREGGG